MYLHYLIFLITLKVGITLSSPFKAEETEVQVASTLRPNEEETELQEAVWVSLWESV